VRRLRAEGLSSRQIAARLNIGKSRAAEIMSELAKKPKRSRANPYRNSLTTEERQALVEQWREFAYQQAAKRMRSQKFSGWAHRLNFEDLCPEAVLALVLAAERWDPDRGVTFGTYAGYWVSRRLFDMLVCESNAGAHAPGTEARFWHCMPTTSYDAPIRPGEDDPRERLMTDPTYSSM
jgi:DNA-directed RNA polymerase sigma subunit (sigma70/sigma32)